MNDCNLTTCRYNKDNKCTNNEKRTECVEVSKRVLCLNEKSSPIKEFSNAASLTLSDPITERFESFRKIENVKHIGNEDDKPIETSELLTSFGVDISQSAVEQYAETHFGRKPRNYLEFCSARNAKIIEESKELGQSMKKERDHEKIICKCADERQNRGRN